MQVRDQIEITRREKTPEGFLLLPAVFARSGIQTYLAAELGVKDRDPSETMNVYRPPEEVFADGSITSFARKPVTNDHPPELVTVDNVGRYQVGWSGDQVERDGDVMRGTIMVTDSMAIAAIEGGKRQLSNGYEAEYDFTPGVTPGGESYDAVQRQIRGNHIAIVDRARCGSVCAVADGHPTKDCDNCPHQGGKGASMKTVTIKGVDVEVSDTAAQLVEQLQADTKAALDMAEEAEKSKEDMEAEKEKAEGEKDAALAQIQDADTIDALVEERAALVNDAQRLVPNVETKGKSNADIRRAVVSEKTGQAMDGKSDAYVEARFDVLAEGGGEADRFARRNPPTKDGGSDDRSAGTKARDEHIARTQDAWKPQDSDAA